MRHRFVAAAVATAALLAPASALAAPPADVAAAVAKGAAFLRTQQDPVTGKLRGFGDDWALSALAAAGVHPADVRVDGGPSAQDGYLATWTSEDWTGSAADSSRALLNAVAAGLQPTRLDARSNLVAELAAQHQPNGAFGTPTNLNATVFSVLALSRTKVPKPVLVRSADVIRASVHDDGGWGWTAATTPAEEAEPGDIDMTGAAVAALCASGATASDPAVAGGLALLRSQLDPATGAFNAVFGPNADSNAWAIAGLVECGIDPQSAAWTTTQGKTPVDFILAQQRADGAFRTPWEAPTDPGSLFTSQNAVRALAGASFSAAPVGGRVRAGATVADGTPVPTVLAIDDGKGNARLCRVTAPVGASVTAVLEAADCVSRLTVAGGRVTSLDGATPDNPLGGWVASIDGGAEAFVAGQRVGFGDIVSVRLQHTPLPGMLSAPAVDFGSVTVGTVGAARSVTFTAGGAFPVTPSRAVTTGDDFLIVEDGCAETTLQPGETCTVRVRFAPSEAGARTGSVKLLGSAVATATVTGSGTVLAAAPAPVVAVPGPKGDKGDRGSRGHAAKVTCKTTGSKRRSVRCTLKANGSARLTRQGRVVARGTSTTLRAGKRVARGVYTLRVGNLRVQVRIA